MTLQTSPYETSIPSPEANGHSAADSPLAAVSPAGPQVQRRFDWIDLPKDEYPGFRARIWVNFPGRVQRALETGDEKQRLHALSEVVVEHNGWRNEDGAPYPPATDLGERCEAIHPHLEGEACPGLIRPGFWDEIGTELAGTLIAAAMVRVGKLSTSLVPTRRGR